MIYWEKINPLLEVTVRIERMDVLEWRDPVQWASGEDVDWILPWSGALSDVEARTLVHLHTPPLGVYSDYLVIYGAENHFWRVSLIGFLPNAPLTGFSQEAPYWWFTEGTTPLHALLARARSRREVVRSYVNKRRVMDIPLPEMVPGHCRTCGLPLKKHVEHQPPGVEQPKDGVPLEEWQTYRKAFMQHYLAALKNLTEDELLGMALPKGVHHIRVLEMEVKRRIDNPPEIASRLDRLLADDDELG